VSGQRAVAFEFDRVTVVRAGRRVLDEVTARIPGAGITVVSGPSGAGKTTLLRLCNRRIYQLRGGHLTGIPAERVSP